MEIALPNCPICNCPVNDAEERCRRCECDLGLLRLVLIYAEDFKRKGELVKSRALVRNSG